MSGLLDVLSLLLLGAGCVFFVAGTVGLLRFPDIYCRLHALTKADTLGLGLVAAGLALQLDAWSAILQLGVIWFLALAAAATVCHLLASASLRQGVEPASGNAPKPAAVPGSDRGGQG